MDTTEISEQIEISSLLAGILHIEQSCIESTTVLKSLPSWDSLTVLQIVMALESSTGVAIEGVEIFQQETVQELMNYLDGQGVSGKI